MSKINARNKGQRGEREVIDLLQPIVDEVRMVKGLEPILLQRNTLQSDRGGFDIAGIDWCAIEVKRQERLNENMNTCSYRYIDICWEQCRRQAAGREPILLWRSNKQPWRARIISNLWIYNSTQTLQCTINIGQDDFLAYFRARCNAEF